MNNTKAIRTAVKTILKNVAKRFGYKMINDIPYKMVRDEFYKILLIRDRPSL